MGYSACSIRILWQVVTLRFSFSIPVRLLGAGSAAVLVCGMALAQASHRPAEPNRDQSKARLLVVSSSSTSHSTSRNNKKSRKGTSSRRRGQQKIDATRAREIQEGLIREHYLDGTASGIWDVRSQTAMERFQADNGWQSKVVPDSRALIKMGLGPDHEHLLNPESAMTSQSDPPRVSPILNQAPAVVAPPQK
jgi:hypothetical protein